MAAFCSGLCNEISRCCYDFYHAPFTKKNLLIGGGVLLGLIIIIIIIVCAAGPSSSHNDETGSSVLKKYPLIDGANSLSRNLKYYFMDRLSDVQLNTNLSSFWEKESCNSCQTDLKRLKQGFVATQVWSVTTDCAAQSKDAVSETLEQIDLMKRIFSNPKNKMDLVTQAIDIAKFFDSKKSGAILSVWGGHNIDSRLAVLRMYYDLGVRIMALVQTDGNITCSPPWINNETGLLDFGLKVVAEMNRLGMIIDLTGSNEAVQKSVLNATKAPVIFSHSGSATLNENGLNINDYVLQHYSKSENLGLIMVPFTPSQLTSNSTSSLADVHKHLNLLKGFTSKLGIGSNFDNMSTVTKGLEDVSKFPALFDYLKKQDPKNWTDNALEGLAGQNFIKMFKAVEKAKGNGTDTADGSIMSEELFGVNTSCYSDFQIRYRNRPAPPTKSTTTPTTKPTTEPTKSTTPKKPT